MRNYKWNMHWPLFPESCLFDTFVCGRQQLDRRDMERENIFSVEMFASDALRQTKCFNFNQKQIKNVYEIALLGLHRYGVVNTRRLGNASRRRFLFRERTEVS